MIQKRGVRCNAALQQMKGLTRGRRLQAKGWEANGSAASAWDVWGFEEEFSARECGREGMPNRSPENGWSVNAG
jgi:hypothetical protein